MQLTNQNCTHSEYVQNNSAGLRTRSTFIRVQVRVLRILFFEFKFEFGENDRVQRVRVRSPGLYRLQWHEQINDMQLFFW